MADAQPKRVLITRPAEDAYDTQRILDAANIQSDRQPFLSVHMHEVKIDTAQYDALIFTSRNAVRSYCKSNTARNITVYCVGDRTAQLCQGNGFKDVQSASGTLQDLQSLLAKQKFSNPILYLRGKDISAPIVHQHLQEHFEKHSPHLP